MELAALDPAGLESAVSALRGAPLPRGRFWSGVVEWPIPRSSWDELGRLIEAWLTLPDDVRNITRFHNASKQIIETYLEREKHVALGRVAQIAYDMSVRVLSEGAGGIVGRS